MLNINLILSIKLNKEFKRDTVRGGIGEFKSVIFFFEY